MQWFASLYKLFVNVHACVEKSQRCKTRGFFKKKWCIKIYKIAYKNNITDVLKLDYACGICGTVFLLFFLNAA